MVRYSSEIRTPEPIKSLLASKPDGRALVKASESHRPKSLPSKKRWLRLLHEVDGLFESPLDWLGEGDQAYVRWKAKELVLDALTVFPPRVQIEEAELKEALGGFLRWLAPQSDSEVVAFCWRVRRSEQSWMLGSPVYWLRDEGRLKGSLQLEAIDLAMTLVAEAEAMFWWPDERLEDHGMGLCVAPLRSRHGA
jgi:hypothetical protein